MKEKFVFVCQQCGQNYSKWVGKCQECGSWNSVTEERDTRRSKNSAHEVSQNKPLHLSEIALSDSPRIISELTELDNVLGGGLVPGSVVLIGGEPGIGKSTLLLQAAYQYIKARKKVLYVTGEESLKQIALRSSRLGVSDDTLLVLPETALERIVDCVEEVSPDLLIVDSIQTIHCAEVDSQAGSVGQLRECAFNLITLAKSREIATFVVGHVTKEGAIAGPKVLEHMVDVVLYFEGTTGQSHRLLRSIKNRFGSSNEVAVFEMSSNGLRQVSNPSELFLSERPFKVPGSVVTASLEGTRPILVEVQALASNSPLAMPRRTSIGLDSNRVSLLVAILEKRAGIRLFDQDVYVNVAGGLRLVEPAADLAVTAAILSSYQGKEFDHKSIFFGEVGLGGEIRSVPRTGIRLKEAERIGFTKAFLPRKGASSLADSSQIELVFVDHVSDLK